MCAEDQRTQVMNSSALRFHITGNDSDDTPEGLETQKMYHHIPPYVSDLESSQLEPINATDRSQNEDNPIQIATGVDQLYYQNGLSHQNDHHPLPLEDLLARHPFFTPRDSHPDLPAHPSQQPTTIINNNHINFYSGPFPDHHYLPQGQPANLNMSRLNLSALDTSQQAHYDEGSLVNQSLPGGESATYRKSVINNARLRLINSNNKNGGALNSSRVHQSLLGPDGS